MFILSSNDKTFTYVIADPDEEIDDEWLESRPIVIIRNGQQPFEQTVVNILQYISDNPMAL